MRIKGLIIIPNAKGSSLDPSADQISLITTKVGIDATRSLLKPKENLSESEFLARKRLK